MGGEGPLWSINKNPTRSTLLEETTEAKSPLKGHKISKWLFVGPSAVVQTKQSFLITAM